LPNLDRAYRHGWDDCIAATIRYLASVRDSADNAACQLLREGQG